jgi:choline dehydrogenase-like flavoprotein
MTVAEDSFEVLILGGGTAGCVLAARLSENPERTVCLVEAGTDYGHLDEGHWPADLLDPTDPPTSHDWEPGGELSGARCKVLGGCSAHNASFVVWPSPEDCDEWEPFGGSAWTFAELEPYLRRAEGRLRTRPLEDEERNPWARQLLEGATALGLQPIDSLNDFDAARGIAWIPVNVSRGARWSTALAYLDEARARPNLDVVADTLIERVLVSDDHAEGAVVHGPSGSSELRAGLVIVSAGAYGSPAILLRSGIGPGEQLTEHGIPAQIDLAGVGGNLVDHSGVSIGFKPSAELIEELEDQSRSGRMFRAGTIARAGSASCPQDTWDLHLLSWTPRDEEGAWGARFSAYAMKPQSTGNVRLRDADPASLPQVEHGFISDAAGQDSATILDGLEQLRQIAANRIEAGAIETEIEPGPAAEGRQGLAEHLRANVRGYFHPVGTCRVGSADDPEAVVDGNCRLHGIDNLYVCDASVMPTIPRANTNLITVAIAEQIADSLGPGSAL